MSLFRILVALTASIILIGCGDDQHYFKILSYHENGIKEREVELSRTGDTISYRIYHENGKLSTFIPYDKNRVNGIVYEYNDKGSVVQNQLTIDGEMMVIQKRYLAESGSDSITGYFQTFIKNGESLFRPKGALVYKPNGTIDHERSYMYAVDSTRDTVNFSEDYEFRVEVMTMEQDSAYTQIVLGKLNPDYSVTDTTHFVAQWDKQFTLTVKPAKRGRNYIFGTVTMVVLYPELNDFGMDTLAFYKEFYAR